ncbi:hypothetical protein [Hymenobacter setariae]|uniref:hypothetical protein n=1 Tax=Hymenobacter setariae TaxID=2594794 RepID=UPI001F44F4CF|nr:hypothetical protein [Hymenobacter setariae]
MAKNQVTEADLREYYEQWQRLQVVHQAKQARYEPKPATGLGPIEATISTHT